MGSDAVILGLILLFTALAFVFEWLPIDLVALTSMSLVMVFGLVTPQQAVAGFSNEAVITVLMIFILSEGLVRSGLLAWLAHRLARLSGATHWRGSVTLLGMAGVLSAFINNVAALTIFLPVSLQLARQYRVSPSRLLIPLSYATIFGGACTLIGTSTNLLISSLAGEFGFEPIGMFELAGLGSLLFVIGMVYVVLVPMRRLPERAPVGSLTGKYRLSDYLTELRVPASSPLVGRTVLEERVSERFSINVLEIVRGGQRISTDLRHTPIREGDTLLVRAAMDDIVAFRTQRGLQLPTDAKLHDEDLVDARNILAEVQISPASRLVGDTIQDLEFRKTFGCFVLALDRTGETIRQKIAFVPLQRWDTLLVFGPRARIEALEHSDDFLPLREVELHLRLRRRWWIPAVVVPLVVLAAATGWTSILESSILGAVTLLVTRCLTMQQAYRAINWTVIFLVAAILPLGRAMIDTGLAAAIADSLVRLGAAAGPLAVVSVLYLVTTFLTEIMSNNSTAVLMLPIAISAAATLGVDARPLLMAVTFGASASLLTPMGYKTNAMVHGPGAYRVVDFLKTGFPLKLAFWIVTVLAIPRIWPF